MWFTIWDFKTWILVYEAFGTDKKLCIGIFSPPLDRISIKIFFLLGYAL